MKKFATSPAEMIRSLWQHRQLIWKLSEREIIGRYQGSMLGLAWSFFNPLLMLIIYTFVFSVVFKARWGIGADESKTDFAIILFVGLIIHGIFAECVNKAPQHITSNVNYVKKVIFPLEILPWVGLVSAMFHTAASLIILLAAQMVLNQHVPLTAVLLPIVAVPLLLMIMGFSWILSSLGTYLRDIGQITAMLTTVLLFVSAVFFPISSLPPRYQSWVSLNPMAFIIEQARDVMIFGKLPNFEALGLLTVGSLLFAWIGFAWFQKTRSGFADVL